jgi:hypothetical protein
MSDQNCGRYSSLFPSLKSRGVDEEISAIRNYLRLSGKSATNIIDHLPRLNFQGFSNIDELDDIEPAFAALVLANEGLRAAQLFCQIDLRQLGFMPRPNQGGAEFGVALAENGSCHTANAKPVAGLSQNRLLLSSVRVNLRPLSHVRSSGGKMGTTVQDAGTKPGPVEKRCSVCGVDVSNKKRTKNRAGNYFCQTCYEAAVSKTALQADINGTTKDHSVNHAASTVVSTQAPITTQSPKSEAPKQNIRSLKRVVILAAITLGIVIAAAVIWAFLFVQPTWRDVSAANQKVNANWQKIIEDSKSDSSQTTVPITPTPANVAPAIDGEVWVQKGSGETLLVATEQVYLLPLSLKIDGPNGDFHFGITKVQTSIDAAANLPDNQLAAAEAKQAQSVLDKLSPYLNAQSVPANAAIDASIGSVTLSVGQYKMHKDMLGDDDPSLLESEISTEGFWKFVTSQALATVTTGRDGKYSIQGIPPGKYVIACRFSNSALSGVVYWALVVDTSTGDAHGDLTPSNGIVVTY